MNDDDFRRIHQADTLWRIVFGGSLLMVLLLLLALVCVGLWRLIHG